MTVVERIFIHPIGAPRTERRLVQVVAGAGIEGDRNFARHDEPGQNVTLVEAEEIEAFFGEDDRALDPSLFGRTLVCRDVRLHELVGREFMVGEVRLRGVELCEPCRSLGRALASDVLDAPSVVKRLLHRAGLRADALSTGVIQVGDRIRDVDSSRV